MKDKKDIVWSNNLFEKLIKEYSDVILQISEDREKELREMINNCEEIKLFKYEDRHLKDKKKLTNNEKKVLGSTFSSILSEDNSSDEEWLKEEFNDLTKNLSDDPDGDPLSISVQQLAKLTKTDSFKKIKSFVSKGVDITSKTFDVVFNNALSKFIKDMFFSPGGIGTMNLTSYVVMGFNDIKNSIKKFADSSKEDNTKLIKNINSVTNTTNFKLLTTVINEIEKYSEKQAQTVLKKLALNSVIFKSLDDLNNLNENDLEEQRYYLIKTPGELINSIKDNKETIRVKANDLVFLKSKDPLIWEKVINPKKIDLFSLIVVVMYNIFIKEKSSYKYILANFVEEKTKTFFKEIHNIFSNAELNDIQRKSECAKIYLKFLRNNSSFDPLLSFIAYMSFVIKYKNSFEKFSRESSLNLPKKDANKKDNLEEKNNYLDKVLSDVNYLNTELIKYNLLEENTYKINNDILYKGVKEDKSKTDNPKIPTFAINRFRSKTFKIQRTFSKTRFNNKIKEIISEYIKENPYSFTDTKPFEIFVLQNVISAFITTILNTKSEVSLRNELNEYIEEIK